MHKKLPPLYTIRIASLVPNGPNVTSNLYEPEGIYFDQLTNPIGRVVQRWGESPEHYSQFKYNGVTVSGYLGLGLQVQHDAEILAVGNGKVMEIGIDEGGFDKYIKVVHWWGESIYALLGSIHVASGQTVLRGTMLATIGYLLSTNSADKRTARFHFGIRISPYNRFDGGGGFTDPLPYVAPTAIQEQSTDPDTDTDSLLPLLEERPYMRRP